MAETGLEFRFLFAIYEGGSGGPATKEDAEGYAIEIGAETFPVFADNTNQYANVTPMTQKTHPELCAVTPAFEILSCYSGHNSYLTALDDIRAHAGL